MNDIEVRRITSHVTQSPLISPIVDKLSPSVPISPIVDKRQAAPVRSLLE
jgi:hypothetical protein